MRCAIAVSVAALLAFGASADVAAQKKKKWRPEKDPALARMLKDFHANVKRQERILRHYRDQELKAIADTYGLEDPQRRKAVRRAEAIYKKQSRDLVAKGRPSTLD